tara:strand:- start:870 stop:1754 length:885 start_codon:yes stop_codon:yes gene_type:complete
LNKYLIFRTDRVGDFLVTAILLKSIKENDPTAHISVIGSIKNSEYIKTFPFVDNVIQLDNDFLSKIIVFFKVFKFKYKSIIIHDNKRRSKFISYFLKSTNRIDISDFKDNTHIEIIKNILQKMEFNFSNKALNILSHRNPKNNSYEKNQIQLHFDEKWIFNDYIKKFVNIEPAENELINFIKEIVKKKEKKLIITTGINLPNKMNKIENELNELNISLHKNLDFLELEKITSQSKVLISCHGAISHVAAAYNIKQIDIIDKTYDYSRWTNHFRNYNYLYRDNFSKLSCRILDLI